MMKDKVIKLSVDIVLMQEKEIDELREKIGRIEQYIEVYEEYIEGN